MSGSEFGTFFSGAVSDPRDLELLPAYGADSVPPLEDAPIGAFVVRLRNEGEALVEWESQRHRPEMHAW
jgi:hypothetical protein